MSIHTQAKIVHSIFTKNLDVYINVDTLLVPILVPLWDKGIVTRYSCQGINKGEWDKHPEHETSAYIAFDAAYLNAMCGMMLTFFSPRKLRWELDDSKYEKTYGHPRLTGPMFTVRFPRLKDLR